VPTPADLRLQHAEVREPRFARTFTLSTDFRCRMTEMVCGAGRECAGRGGCPTGACTSTLLLHQYSSSGAAVGAGFSSFSASATVASVVRISPAIEAAF
jgi:hypothetical protein